jgi:hypothetical protein
LSDRWLPVPWPPAEAAEDHFWALPPGWPVPAAKPVVPWSDCR